MGARSQQLGWTTSIKCSRNIADGLNIGYVVMMN